MMGEGHKFLLILYYNDIIL